MVDFELRYIHPIWATRTEVLSIEKSDSCIEVDEITPNEYVANTIAYIKINEKEAAYIGIKLQSQDVTPYVEQADGKLIPLECIKKTEDDVWWIISNGWDKENKDFSSHAYFKMGKISIFIEKKHLVLTNEPTNFSYSDLEYILNDFKSDMWQILVDKNSITSADIKNNTPGFNSDEAILFLEKFLSGVEKILKHPEKKVVQIVEEISRNKAKCTKDTINDLIKHPYSLKLKSRGNVESFDTPCNRYIHFCLNRIIYIMNIYKKISYDKKVFIQKSLVNLEKKKIKYLEQDYKKIQQDVFKNQINSVEKQIQSLHYELSFLENKLQCSVNNPYLNCCEHRIKFTKKWTNEDNTYFIRMEPKPDITQNYDYIALKLPISWSHLLLGIDDLIKYEFYIKAYYATEFHQKNKIGLIISITEIGSVRIRSPKLDELQKNLNELKNSNPSIATITSEELSFINKEKTNSYSKLNSFYENASYLEKIENRIETVIKKANNLKKQIEKLHIGLQDSFPQSILFVTNNLYSSTYNIYRSITTKFGINDLLIKQLERVEKIGLIKICEIYEYWCLINIIKTLVVKLQFSIENNWQKKLVNTILSSKKELPPVSFHLIHKTQSTPIELELHYQCFLSSGKRPDFVIELIGKNSSVNTSSKLILDAKFRGDDTNEKIEYDVNKMYYGEDKIPKGRNYSENGMNSVFILHTSSKAMFDNKDNFLSLSPLKWGAYSSYGGENCLDHIKGHIFFLPSPRYSDSLDNLQRLIGSFIQQHSVMDMKNNNLYMENVICIGCGSENVHIEVRMTQAGNIKYYITCNDCNLTSVRTLCYKCRRGALYKNGLWWTYHINKATEIYNVVCPTCGAYF